MGEIQIINGKKMEYKPADPGRDLSDAVLYYILAMIPQGKLIVDTTLEKYLAEKLNVSWVIFNHEPMDDYMNLEYALKYKKEEYKLLNCNGWVSHIYEERLREEGFETEPVTKYMVKVKDYKKYLFNLEEQQWITAQWIERISKIGMASLRELDQILKDNERN